MKALVTGAAGFIGSSLVDKLLQLGWNVDGVDNLSTGNLSFLKSASKNKMFNYINLDLLSGDYGLLSSDYDYVFHFAANADIRGGHADTKIDLEQNILVTHNILEFIKKICTHKNVVLAFASTAAVLGEPKIFPTPENVSIPFQTSLYGASKISCESLISAYSNMFGLEAYAFRFVSILGPRYTHGHVFDFVKKLTVDPKNLYVLGNGQAEKSYLHVEDCISGVLRVTVERRPAKRFEHKFDVFNLGLDETIKVEDSARWIADCMNLSPAFHFESQLRGWIGDNKFVHLSTEKIRKIGWDPSFTLKSSIKSTVDYLTQNPHILMSR